MTEGMKEEEDKRVVGERGIPGNCRDCKNWNLKDMAKMDKRAAADGFGKCNVHDRLLPVASWICNEWERAEERTVSARRRFLGITSAAGAGKAEEVMTCAQCS